MLPAHRAAISRGRAPKGAEFPVASGRGRTGAARPSGADPGNPRRLYPGREPDGGPGGGVARGGPGLGQRSGRSRRLGAGDDPGDPVPPPSQASPHLRPRAVSVAASGGKRLSGLPAMAGRGHAVCPERRCVSGDLPDPGLGTVDSIILTTPPRPRGCGWGPCGHRGGAPSPLRCMPWGCTENATSSRCIVRCSPAPTEPRGR